MRTVVLHSSIPHINFSPIFRTYTRVLRSTSHVLLSSSIAQIPPEAISVAFWDEPRQMTKITNVSANIAAAIVSGNV